jgi:hypothetical protein
MSILTYHMLVNPTPVSRHTRTLASSSANAHAEQEPRNRLEIVLTSCAAAQRSYHLLLTDTPQARAACTVDITGMNVFLHTPVVQTRQNWHWSSELGADQCPIPSPLAYLRASLGGKHDLDHRLLFSTRLMLVNEPMQRTNPQRYIALMPVKSSTYT